ncbi:hypothetical protein RYX36_001788 [Vicia faba]
MNQQTMELGYNANKLPLGKLSKATILKGYNILKILKLKRKLEMVEALAKIEVAIKLLKDDAEMEGDPPYAHYQCLHCGTKEFSVIENYMKNTHIKTHSNYTVVYQDISKGDEDDVWLMQG